MFHKWLMILAVNIFRESFVCSLNGTNIQSQLRLLWRHCLTMDLQDSNQT
jgi:hypothetical protein